MKNFPHEIYQAKQLFIYTGPRSGAKKFAGYFAEIESIELTHKSYLPGKENSSTEFYFWVKLKANFKEIDLNNRELDPEILFSHGDKENVLRINSMKFFLIVF